MSEQNLNLENDWEEIKQAFRNHFIPEKLEIDEEKIKYSKSGEHLIIEKNGDVSGAMPLHETTISDAKEIIFRDSEIELRSDDFSYKFRR